MALTWGAIKQAVDARIDNDTTIGSIHIEGDKPIVVVNQDTAGGAATIESSESQ